MDKFYFKKELVAVRIKKITKGSVPQTEPNQPLQLVTLKHPKGTYLKAHLHKAKKRKTDSLQECLIVNRGKVKIDLYSNGKKHFKSVYLSQGEILILIKGGYGIHLLKDSELIEVKNGPFKEDKILINS